MTTLLQGRQGRLQLTGEAQEQTQGPQQGSEINVGQGERAVSLAAGSILAVLGLSRHSIPGLIVAGVGGSLLYRGVTGYCGAYERMGINTAEPEQAEDVQKDLDEKGIHVEAAYTIRKPAEQLYSFWRNFENLPGIMTHLQSVKVLDDKKSHWVATAPKIAGGKVEWDAEITRDEPNRAIAWRSLPGSQIECAGEIRFSKALGDRGTEVHVFMEYLPPAGKVGHWVATLFGEAPRRQMRSDLRNFKTLMEVGEIPTIAGQPKGTCTGHGTRSQG